MLALKMSPLEMCFSPKVLVMRPDTVPFPDPGAPMMTARITLGSTMSNRVWTDFYRVTEQVFPSHETQSRSTLSSPCKTAQRKKEWARLKQLVWTLGGPFMLRSACTKWRKRRRRRRRKMMRTTISGFRASQPASQREEVRWCTPQTTHTEQNELLSPACWETYPPPFKHCALPDMYLLYNTLYNWSTGRINSLLARWRCLILYEPIPCVADWLAGSPGTLGWTTTRLLPHTNL